MANKRSFVLSDEAIVTITNKVTGNIEFEGEILTSDIEIIPPERQDYTEINFKNGSTLMYPKSIEKVVRGNSSRNLILFDED